MTTTNRRRTLGSGSSSILPQIHDQFGNEASSRQQQQQCHGQLRSSHTYADKKGKPSFVYARRVWRALLNSSPNVSPKMAIQLIAALLATFFIAKFFSRRNHHRGYLQVFAHRSLRPFSDADAEYLMVEIPKFGDKIGDVGGWALPSNFYLPGELEDKKRAKRPNHGGLQIDELPAENFFRDIHWNETKRYNEHREEYLEDVRKWISESQIRSVDLADKPPKECRRASWIFDYHPNCNAIHAIDMTEDFHEDRTGLGDEQIHDSFYISHGYFRDAWVVETMPHIAYARSVLKMSRYKYDVKQGTLDVTLRDALVMEKLNGSPQIVDIYGHCGTAVWVEAMPYEVEEYIVPDSGYAKQKELDEKPDVEPRNDFSVAEKLQMALEMAQTLAIMHGFKDGLIIHDDVQLCQWLRSEEGSLKLGDFNRAEIPEYNVTSGQYCRYQNGAAYGNYRSPEEFADLPLTEQLDIFSYGNNLYGMLTGLWVFYENEDDSVVHSKLIDRNTSYIDPRYEARSYGEKKLVEIIRLCWEYDPDNRIDIFSIVKMLEEIVRENERIEREETTKQLG